MKNKPLRHKETNTFKFIPFSERIGNIKVDVVHQIKHKYELETEDTTYFYQTYEKWIPLNCSQCFAELLQDLTKDIRTLPQLLARKEEIIEILKHHLSLKNPLNLQAVLEFIVALAKDIRQEFHPHFFSFYSLLSSLLNVKDAEQLEWVFQCLAYLFKFLWRYLINNLTEVFESILPLLNESKPPFIRNYAAQSFAFVARKIKDESKLVRLIVKPLKVKPHAIEGCGTLVFEIIRGIKGHLHSCGEKILNAFILSLKNTIFPHSVVCELLFHILNKLLPFLSVSEVPTLWKILQDSLQLFHQECKENTTDRNVGNIEQILSMIQKAVEFKSCSMVTDPNALVTLLLKLLESHNQIKPHITDRISLILSHLLLYSKTLPQELSSRIVIGAMMYLNEDDLLTFVLRIINFSGFDGLVLSRLLSFCLQISSPKKALPVLAKIILHKAPPASDVRQLVVWSPYSLNFSLSKNGSPSDFTNSFLKTLSDISDTDQLLENFEECILILNILPHVLPLAKEEVISSIKNLINIICNSNSLKTENTVNSSSLLYILSVALECLIYLKPNDCITKLLEPENILPVLLKYSTPEYIFVIRSLDFYVSGDELNEVLKNSEEIKNHLAPYLLSPYEKVRLHVTHILFEIENALGSNKLLSSILENCWHAECIPVTLQEYREKLKLLQKLDCSNETLRNALINNILPGQIPLSYLFGTLFINFKLLWDPISKIIMSYGPTITPAAFWEIFGKQLNEVILAIRESKITKNVLIDFKCEHLQEEFTRLNIYNEKPDYINYRIMMLNIIKDLPEVYEFKSKDIVLHFIAFLEEEYNKKFSEAARTWNIKVLNDNNETLNISEMEHSVMDNDIEMNSSLMKNDEEMDQSENINLEQMDVDDDLKEESDISSTAILNASIENKNSLKDNSSSKIEEKTKENEESNSNEIDEIKKKLTEDNLPETDWKSKWITKSLLAYMGIFGKFRSPKSLYMEPELNKIFNDFLSSRVADIQKCALDFILSYKSKHLVPYKEHLYGLIDDKTFKNQLSLFRIDTQSDLVREEHRPYLIPIVLRIVHSKMYSKVSTSRRETRQARKAAVLRFLAGCSSEELSNFIKMAFTHFMDNMKDVCDDMVSEIMDSINFERCIPPRRLFTSAHLLNIIISHCGGLMIDEQKAFLLKLILIIACYASVILSKRDEIHPAYIKVIKNVKTSCFDAISQFFLIYEKYYWSEDETNAFFKVLIWPYLNQLISEGVNSPTALLKLFVAWSKNYRYFHLLVKNNVNGHSALSTIIELWTVPKLHPSVHNTIVDFFHNIISFEGDDEVSVNGIDVVSSYMPKILQILQDRSSSRKSLSKKELAVLSIVTSSAKEYISSESLLSIVLPQLLKSSKKNDEEISDLLNSVGNLITKASEPMKHLRQLVTLFSSLQTPGHRKLLLSTVVEVSKHIGATINEDILLDLYAWDPKWVEQPDFNKRLQAYMDIEKIEDKIHPILGAIIIRTSFYYLKEEKDLSLKESARHCLKTFCPKICNFFKESKDELALLLDETILPLIKTGLNDQSELFRHECISILGFMVRGCDSIHPVLVDLVPFSNKTDLEVDFYENLVHLQLHRRVRAMLRFSEIIDTSEKKFHPKTLISYGVPMITQYLLSPKYADKNTIVDSAIKALSSICRSLSWRYYYTLLRFYLGKLQSGTDFQKQVIRIVSEMLNAFHFNLTEAEELKDEIAPTELNEENESITIKEVTEAEDETEIIEKSEEIDIKEKDKPLEKSTANNIIHELSRVILPNLQKLLSDKSNADSFHKVNKRMSYAEKDEDDMLRIPLAIAIVKLLQKLPSSRLLERNLHGLFLKLANFLKSRSESVRRCARTTLETIMTSLGPKYLPKLLSELCSILTKGFQVHVLTYTVHGVLSQLKPFYNQGDIDPCIDKILSVCISDLFGAVSEEKEVNHIVAKTIEAKANRSYDIFKILATYSSEKYLLDMILPLKEELNQTISHKIIKKASDCLQQIALGLTENEYLSPQSLLELAYGLSTESIPALIAKEVETRDAKQLEYESRRDPDAFIIPEEPKQKKSLVTIECAKTNAHILVEFGLKILYFILKREKLNKQQFKPMLEPLVKLLLDCLDSKHVKVSTLALKCFSWVLKMELESVNSNIKEISTIFLEILHKYAAAGLSKGDNFDLVMAAFKAVSVLIRSVKSWKPSFDDRRVLLLYCEQDIDDRERQATAFSLLKALIHCKINFTELGAVMKKVATVSIISPIDSVRLQARQVMLTYLMEYRIGNEVITFLSFYLSQLSYKTKIGRESALAMIRTLISSFPKENINEECGLIFVNVATRLVNEDDPDCQKEAAALIILLLQKIDQNGKDKLFDVTTAWIKGKKLLHRRLGFQLIGLFATAEKIDFEQRIEPFLKLSVNELRSGFFEHKPGRFVLLRKQETENENEANMEKSSDHLAFHALQSLLKVFTLFPKTLNDNKYADNIDLIFDECQSLLAHEHEWVRTLAVQVLGLILTTKQIPGSKSLALDLLSQLIPSVGDALLMQCMKLLVHISVAISNTPEDEGEFTLSWIVRKVRHAVNKEIVHSPTSTQIRKMACKWGAALSMKLSRENLKLVAFDLLTPIVKELSSGDQDLAKSAKEAGNYFKGKLGQSEYNNLVSRITQKIEVKKAIRKKERSQLAVTDPEKAAKRKINKQLKKKVLKKRKVELMKTHKFKRKPKKDIDLDL